MYSIFIIISDLLDSLIKMPGKKGLTINQLINK